jgi:DNA-binding CsgD family transcriptional regulator
VVPLPAREGHAAAEVPHDCPLTGRQYLVIKFLASGSSITEVAHALGLSPSAVRTHKQDGLKRLLAEDIDAASRVLHATGWWDAESVEPPLRGDQPFLSAYLQAFERSGWPLNEPDDRSAAGMRLALAGHRITTTASKEA